MQAYLPDINTAYISYRGEAIRSIKSEHYDSAFGAVYAINAILPEDYRVRISTIEYLEATKEDLEAICSQCKELSNIKSIKIFDKYLSSLIQMITSKDTEKFWLCPHCKKENSISKTDFIRSVLEEPHLLKIVPRPPERKDGLMDRLKYDKQISAWLWNMLSELEGRMSKLREDNWNKGSENDDFEVDTKGESNE